MLDGGRITVLGAGSFGTTVASLLSRRADTALWAKVVKDAGIPAD